MTSPSSRPSTISDVAKLAGVSNMTVSRTLNGHPSVSPATHDAVKRAVDLLGYRRNENARSIRPGHRTGLIGVGITNIGNPYYAEFALGVEHVASQHGRRVILATTGGDIFRETQIVSDFLGRHVEGLILVPTGTQTDHLQAAKLRQVPLVFASRKVEGITADSVLVDDSGGAYQGTRYLLDQGHTTIGYLGTSDTSFTGGRRLQGFLRALADRGAAPHPSLIRVGIQNVEHATEAARDLLATSNPTALFCSNNRNTLGALKAIAAAQALPGQKTRVPEVVSFDDFELSDLIPYPTTIINHDAGALGQQSAELLFERINSPDGSLPTRTISMPTWLETRKSWAGDAR